VKKQKRQEQEGGADSKKRSAAIYVLVLMLLVVAITASAYFLFWDGIREFFFPSPISIQIPVESQNELIEENVGGEESFLSTADATEDNRTVGEETLLFDDSVAEDNATGDETPVSEAPPEEEENSEPAPVAEAVMEPAKPPVSVASPKPVKTAKPVETAKSMEAPKPVVTTARKPAEVAKPPVKPQAASSAQTVKAQYASFMAMGASEFENGNLKAAQGYFLKAYMLVPDEAVAYNIALIYLQRNLPGRAAAWIKKVKLDEKDASDLLIDMISDGNLATASLAITHLLPQDKTGYIYYASAYMKEALGDIEQASKDYNTAMLRSNYDGYVTYAYARTLDQLGDYDGARVFYASAVNSGIRQVSNAAIDRLSVLE
jgi:Tfp pilus assembly protein PilF